MKRWLLFVLILPMGYPAERGKLIMDPAESRAFKQKYVALTDSWIQGIVFTPAEQASMRAGKKWEDAMSAGPDDPLAKRILAAGEPSFDALAAVYPGKILDRTILGSYSDPREPADGYHDEFAIYWNGAIGANLIKGRLTDRLGATGVQPLALNTAIEFRVGADAEAFGRVRQNFSSIRLEKGFLPIVIASYEHDGVRYSETALAYKPRGETDGWDVGYVRFEMRNMSKTRRPAELLERVILNDAGKVHYSNGRLLDEKNAILLIDSDAAGSFVEARQGIRHRFDLRPGETKLVCLKIPYLPDAKGMLQPASDSGFASAHKSVAEFWEGLLAKGADIEVPEQRVNDVWRALLLQNFVLADGPKFTYGSGLRYNDSTYPQENGFATHVFAMYGFKDYADALQPWFVGMSVTHEGAGRKYQNRRAMVLHHLLENYRLTGKTDLFDRFQNDYFRVADEIIADRHSTMTPGSVERPLYWGLLPPDKPGVDVQASTQTVYVLGHNITNCQGLRDFGRFLVATGIDKQRGERYIREAADFRQTLMSAMQRAAIRVPGRPPFVDLQTLLFRQTPDYGPEPYDDLARGRLQGSYFHYWVDMEFHYNFFNADDEVGHWLADYVQQRNGFVLGLTRARTMNEPTYGHVNNVYDGGYYNFRLRSGQIDEFLLGFYSRLAFGMSRNVYVSAEGVPFIRYNTENGGYVGADYPLPNSASNADTLLMLRNALVLEELKDNVETGKLFLLRAAPKPWFEAGKQIRVRRMATYFGDISFTVDSRVQDRVIRADIDPPQGAWKTLEMAFRRPGSTPIRQVKVNGVPHSGFDVNGIVRVEHRSGPISIEVAY